MSKKLISILITIALMTTMLVPVMAGNGDNVGEDIFSAPSVTTSFSAGAYTLGTFKEFKVSTYCGAYNGEKVQRKIQIQGAAVSGFEYYNGTDWESVSNYNTTVELKNDIDRKFRVKFNKTGMYVLTCTVSDTDGKQLTRSTRYISVSKDNIAVSIKMPPSGLVHSPAEDGSAPYRFSWNSVDEATMYYFYLNGEKLGSTTETIYIVDESYVENLDKYTVGVTTVVVGGDGETIIESVMTTLTYPQEPTEEATTPENVTTKPGTTTPEKVTTKPTITTKVTKPSKVKSFKAKNIKSKKVKLTWKKVKNVSGYQIVYARNKKFTKNKKTVKVKKASITKKTIKKLKKNKTYYFRVRAYKKVNKQLVYGTWSKVRKVKIKK